MLNLTDKSPGKIIAIHQPNYIPWLGFFYKIYQVDVFVFLDDVQFSNKGMHNYHYIKTPQGAFRLKIPVSSNFGDKINEVTIRNELNWRDKHLKTIEANYRKAPNYNAVIKHFESLIYNHEVNLAIFNASIIMDIAQRLGLKTRFVFSSELGIDTQKEEKIIEICKALNAKIYYSGTGAMKYQNEIHFRDNGIDLQYSIFKPFEYCQPWGAFQSNVTIIDYLMNCGYDWERVLKNQTSA